MQAISHIEHSPVLATDRDHIRAIGDAFQDNPRMKFLIGKSDLALRRGIRAIVQFAYFMVKKCGGVYISSSRSTYLLYYRKRELYFSLRDIKHYLQLAWSIIGLGRLQSVWQREQKIKAIRQAKITAEQDQDYLYIWFLAQRRSVQSLAGLMEAKQFILDLSQQLRLPLYMETTEERLVKMYQRCGFQFYESVQDPTSGMTVWFGRYTPAF